MSWRFPRGLVVPVGLLLAAELAGLFGHSSSDSLAAPHAVLLAGLRAAGDGTLLAATADTLASAGAGLAVGGGIGLVLGLLLGFVRPADRLLAVTIETLRPVPSIALLPIALLVWGFGYRMELAIVAFSCAWPMLVVTRGAVAGIDPALLEIARILRLRPLARIGKIVLPAIFPQLFVGLRLAIGIALIVAVTVEIAANPLGLGYAMMMAQQSLHPALMLALLVWIGLLGWALNFGLLRVQRRLSWDTPA